MTKMNKSVLVIAFAAALTACSQEKVSGDTLEEHKIIARENSVENAQRFRSNHVIYKDWDIIPNGDSSQTRTCPQGDGWATMEFYKEGQQKVKVKCSTYSAATGCWLESDFKGKPFAGEDGRCNPDIELKKIKK